MLYDCFRTCIMLRHIQFLQPKHPVHTLHVGLLRDTIINYKTTPDIFTDLKLPFEDLLRQYYPINFLEKILIISFHYAVITQESRYILLHIVIVSKFVTHGTQNRNKSCSRIIL